MYSIDIITLKKEGTRIKDSIGIYKLYYKQTIVYIGMSSSSIMRRVYGSHGKDGHIDNKEFDRIEITPMLDKDDSDIKDEEYRLIQEHSPYYNIMHKTKTTVMTEELKGIIDRDMEVKRLSAMKIKEYWDSQKQIEL
jgi:hypothetical protein